MQNRVRMQETDLKPGLSNPEPALSPPEPKRNRHELHVWAVAYEHLVVTRFGEYFHPMANSELNAASRVKTWSIGAERRYDLIYRNHGREANTEKEITKSRPYIRWMAHLQPAMVQAGPRDDVRRHWTLGWRQLEYRIKGQ